MYSVFGRSVGTGQAAAELGIEEIPFHGSVFRAIQPRRRGDGRRRRWSSEDVDRDESLLWYFMYLPPLDAASQVGSEE